MSIHSINLAAADWTLAISDDDAAPAALRGRTVAARVPGCVHLDLIRARLIEHPDIGFAELDQTWIGECDWIYRCRFVAADDLLRHERVKLRCDGLDTICTLHLNGALIGSAANMFHAHAFDIREFLREGENELNVSFASPLRHIRAEEKRLGARPVNGDWTPYVFIRKSACNFGWDWGPKVATAGIWRPIRIEAWNAARIESARLVVRRDCDDASAWHVSALVEFDSAPTSASRLSARLRDIAGESVCDSQVVMADDARSATITLGLDQPALWWPRGHGPQPLYELEISLNDSTGKTLDCKRRRVGFRTVRLDTSSDSAGSAFTVVVNDRPVFCKGANWIPDGLFPAEISHEQYRRRVAQAADANMNMLRVWGGGIYENDAFYDACDEAGMLVWQDFMFACAMYPEEAPLRQLVTTEARCLTTHLSHHPCIALWCGGNECVWAHEAWGFGQRLAEGQTWGAAYYHQVLPAATSDLTTPYWPNSPYSGVPHIAANDSRHGNQHIWDVWGDGYRGVVPRFCTEFGHQSPPNLATLRDAWPKSELRIGSRAMEHRQRASGGNTGRYGAPLAEWFRAPRDFDEWHFLAQLLAARSVATGVEWWRAHQPRCMGALVWQLNDTWAGHSWSAIDVAGRRKLSWFAARRAFAPRMVTIQPVNGRPNLVAVNDHDDPWCAAATIRWVDLRGNIKEQEKLEIRVESRSARWFECATDSEWPAAPDTAIVADCDGLRATWFFGRDHELAYDAAHCRVEIVNSGMIRVTARTLLRDVSFQLDRVSPNCEADEQLITLLPGESACIPVRGSLATSANIAAPPVMWCANWFGRE